MNHNCIYSPNDTIFAYSIGILNKDIPHIELPSGFRVRVLSEVYDFDRLSKLIWEGFNYDGEIPKIDDEVRIFDTKYFYTSFYLLLLSSNAIIQSGKE